MSDEQPQFEDDVKDGSGQGPTITSMGDWFTDRPALKVVDRSTLEDYANCPHAAHCHETGLVPQNSMALEAGEAVHKAISATTIYYIENHDDLVNDASHRGDIAEDLQTHVMNEVRATRPDLQPEAIDGVAAAVRNWAWFMSDVHAVNIRACDGGERVGRSGQYARDYPEFGVRATSELDLVLATESSEVLEAYDYKTGYTPFSYASVYKTFQFRMHAVLLFDAYPQIQSIHYRVVGTRFNKSTHKAEFLRERYGDYEAQLRSAVKSYVQNQKDHPCWPVSEKCAECDCILHCPAADKDFAMVEEDPQAFVWAMALTEAKLKGMKKLATDYVDRHGDIIAHSFAFGRNKPKERDTATLYTIKERNDESASTAERSAPGTGAGSGSEAA